MEDEWEGVEGEERVAEEVEATAVEEQCTQVDPGMEEEEGDWGEEASEEEERVQ